MRVKSYARNAVKGGTNYKGAKIAGKVSLSLEISL